MDIVNSCNYRFCIWSLLLAAGFLAFQYGSSTDILVPADYDGDGKADITVWRPSDGTWYLLQSANGQRIVSFGANGDVPIPAVP